MMMSFFWFVAAMVLVVLYLSRESGRGLPRGWVERSEGEIARLREEVDRLTRQVHRLSEEQGFLLRLLEEDRLRELQRPKDPEALRAGPGEPRTESHPRGDDGQS